MIIRIFTSKALRLQLNVQELSTLCSDFKNYKESGFPPDTFGRDAPYDDERTWPLVRQEQVAHIHLADSVTCWPPNVLQYRRTSNKTHLVYCKGSTHSDTYLPIILKRQKAKNPRAISLRVDKYHRALASILPPTSTSSPLVIQS